MGDVQAPITRRHYQSQALLEAGLQENQEWGYDEGNERLGIRLSDGTFRYIGQSELFPPGAGVVASLKAATDGIGIKTDHSRGICSFGTPTEEMHIIDLVSDAPGGVATKWIKMGTGSGSDIYYVAGLDWNAIQS